MIVLLKRSVSLFLVLLLIIGVFTACATRADDDANLVTATENIKILPKTVILIGKSAIMPIHLTVFQKWS